MTTCDRCILCAYLPLDNIEYNTQNITQNIEYNTENENQFEDAPSQKNTSSGWGVIILLIIMFIL